MELMFRELDGLMLGCTLPPAAGLAAGVLARRLIALRRAGQGDTDGDQPAGQAHERGAKPPD
ncbi:MAG: hypothetical protein J6M47_05265 [Clostridia bacterium]|nr:hypothetical protein [Clostridia bacterium]